MHLYIIRHGETELNRLGIYQGKGVDAELNATGWAQAEAFYQQYKEVPFDKVYTSTLKRSHQTVEKFIQKGVPGQQLSGLDEMSWGIWEGKERSEESVSITSQLNQLWQSGYYEASFEGGESPQQVLERLKEAVDIIVKSQNKCVLICMHGRAMRLLLCHLLGKPLSEMMSFPHQNTTLYQIEIDDNGVCNMLDFNNTSHLAILQTKQLLS